MQTFDLFNSNSILRKFEVGCIDQIFNKEEVSQTILNQVQETLLRIPVLSPSMCREIKRISHKKHKVAGRAEMGEQCTESAGSCSACTEADKAVIHTVSLSLSSEPDDVSLDTEHNSPIKESTFTM